MSPLLPHYCRKGIGEGYGAQGSLLLLLLLFLLLYCGYCVVVDVDVVGDFDDCFVVRAVVVFAVVVFAAAAEIMKLWTAYIHSISS